MEYADVDDVNRKFWRHQLVRMKYHNPAVPMTVDQLKEQTPDTEATMSIHFTAQDPSHMTSDSATASPAAVNSTTASSTPSDHDTVERVETIDMKHKTESQILDELIRLTGAYTIEPTAAEKEELRSLEEQRIRSELDSKAAAERRAAAKREKELLEQAKGEIAAQTA
jgi:large subunit ribosomal protein MRP49